MTEIPGSIYTKEYIAKVRLASNMLEPPGGEVVCELLDEIVRLQAEIGETGELPEKLDRVNINVLIKKEHIVLLIDGEQTKLTKSTARDLSLALRKAANQLEKRGI